MAREGLNLNIFETKGSVENIARLQDGKVEIAFVQSGTGNPDKTPGLTSLGSLYKEPLWVFVRGDGSDALVDLQGRKIAAGIEGSGTWVIAEQLLSRSGLNVKNTDIRHLAPETVPRRC